MVNEKILLTGATGMLGNHILNILAELPQFEVYPIGRSEPTHQKNFIVCDITHLDSFRKILDDIRPEHVIHCAANVNVNLCEIDKENTLALHVGTASIIASRPFIKKRIYVSTDSVFDGKKGNYSPLDNKNPLNFYAQSKSLGEDEFIKAKQGSIIIRTNLIGYSVPMKKSLFEWGFEALRKGEQITGFSNIIFNPLYARTLANLIVYSVLLKEVESGVYHFGSSGFYSKYEFLKLVSATFGFDQSLILPVEANEVNGVMRPLDTTLNIEESQHKLGIKFPTLDQEVLTIFGDLNKTPYAKRI